LTRFEELKSLTIDEAAELIVRINFTDDYCKGDCPPGPDGEILCDVEIECCKRWLKEEIK